MDVVIRKLLAAAGIVLVTGLLAQGSSAEFAIEVEEQSVPAVPASLTVTNGQCWAVNSASWASSSGATFYELYRSSSSSFTTQTLEYSGPDTFRGIFASSITYLRVRACNSYGCSGYRVGDAPAFYYNGC